MSWHLVAHYLDDLRGAFGLSTFSWNVVRGNIGAWPYQAAIGSVLAWVFVPKIRTYIDNHIKGLHAKLEAQHKERVELAKQHHEAILEATKN